MSRRKSGLSDMQTFTIRTSSPALAKRFRDYCYAHGLIMGAMIEEMMVEFLVNKGIVASREALEIEDVLER